MIRPRYLKQKKKEWKEKKKNKLSYFNVISYSGIKAIIL